MKALKIIVRTAAMCVLAATVFTSAALAASDKTEYGQVTSDDVNLRAEANTESEIIRVLPIGARLQVVAYEDGWYRVLCEGDVGYIRGDYLFVNTNGTRGAYVLEDGVILHGGPSENTYAVQELSCGQGVKIKALIGEWAFVIADKDVGYVRFTQLRTTKGNTAEGSQLRTGMEGTDVRKLQQALYNRGFLSKADITGIFGAKTRTAVSDYQELAGLSSDGIAGAETLNSVYDFSNNIRKENAIYNQVKGTVILLDWFKGGSDWLNKGAHFTVTDVRTGLSFKARRFGGWYHADCEPITAADSAVIYKAAGSRWSWNRRPIWVTYKGKTVAASMHSMPHMANPTASNNFDGHFCIHLLNSKVHANSKACPRHQACVREAYKAGRK